MGATVLSVLLVQGLLLGGLYALIGYGLSTAAGIMREINVAHGDLAILAAYLSLISLRAWGMDPLVSLLWVVPAMFALGLVLQRFLLNRALRFGQNHVIVVTFALSIILENLLLLAFSSNAEALFMPYMISSVRLGPLSTSLIYIMDFAASAATLAILYAFFRFTMIGKAMRALPADPEAARLLGMDPSSIYSYAMGVAMAVTGVTGVLLGSTFTFYPSSGPTYLLIAFGTVVLGGLGNLVGTLIGGVVMGEVFTLSGYFLGANYQMAATLLLILVIMVVRPQGIFKGVIF